MSLLESMNCWSGACATEPPPPPCDYDQVDSEAAEKVGSLGFGQAIVIGCLEVAFAAGSIALARAIVPFVDKVVDYFTDDVKEAKETSEPSSDATNQGQGLWVTKKALSLVNTIFSTQHRTLLDFCRAELGIFRGLDPYDQMLLDRYHQMLLDHPSQHNENVEGFRLLRKHFPYQPLLWIAKMITKDWPHGEFEIYCDGFKRLFGEEDTATLVGDQGSSDTLDTADPSEVFHDALTTLPLGDSVAPVSPNTPVQELITYFEGIGYLTAVPIDRAQALAEAHRAVLDQLPSVSEGLPETSEMEPEKEILGEKGDDAPDGEDSSDVSTDEADFEDHDFCVISNKYTKLE